jgi:hypothetical protein
LGGYHQYARCRALLLYRSGRFESIHPRHPYVHKNKVRTVQAAKLYSLLTVFRFAYYLKVRLSGEHVTPQLSDKGVVVGEAHLTFGGPEGETVEVEAGDAVVIPAGVGRCNEGSSGDFSVIGAYPRGQESYDLRTGEEGERPEVLDNIRNASLPNTDPLFGEEGPLLRYWSK